jgi:uncharacterized protein
MSEPVSTTEPAANDRQGGTSVLLTRRNFLFASAGALALGGAGSAALFSRGNYRGTLLSAFEDERGDQYVGGLQLEATHVFGARVPMRAHGCAVHPHDPTRVLFFARRPGTQAFELDRKANQVRTVLTTPHGRHLAGHGVFSRDGAWLYTPENDYENMRGVLAVRDARTFDVIAELDTHGIDPHEVSLSADGARLIVANGGIMTHPRSYRRKLNIPTMDPSLCVLDAKSGACLEQWRLPDHLLSIRHLAPSMNGTVAIGLQYEGAPETAPSVAALYRPGIGLELLEIPSEGRAHVHGYVASIALSDTEDVIAAACPYGKGIACWSVGTGAYIGFTDASETYGVSRLDDGALIASQRDGTVFTFAGARSRSRFVTFDRESPIRWDDHWTSVVDS